MASSFAARGRVAAFTLAAALGSATVAGAQQPPAAPPPQTGPKVGEIAPDFLVARGNALRAACAIPFSSRR